MRWLIIQSAGYHNGTRDNWTPNHYLRECLALQYALRNNGQEVEIWGKRFDNYPVIPDFNSYDFILCIENYEMDWLPSFREITKPTKIQWCIDLHCGGWHHCSKITKDMDLVLHSTNSLLPRYAQIFNKQKHIYFPNAVDERFFYPRDISKKRESIFVGSSRNRADWLSLLDKTCGTKTFFATGEDMIKLVSEAKIHCNKSIAQDVNYRNFETIGLGTCLLTNSLPELESLGFQDQVNCLLYKENKEAVLKLRKHLNDNSWETIGRAGAEFAKQHTYTKRIESLLKTI